MPAILDSLFHKVVNTTSIHIGVEGGGCWGATKWRGPSNAKAFLWPTGFNSGRFQLHMSQNVARSMPSLASQFCSDSRRLSAWPGKLEPFTDHPSTHGCQTGP